MKTQDDIDNDFVEAYAKRVEEFIRGVFPDSTQENIEVAARSTARHMLGKIHEVGFDVVPRDQSQSVM
jgi:hypothetical protein